MKLSDLIIEHGPYYAAQLNPITAPTTAELNELREELIAARNGREVRKRFTVEADVVDNGERPIMRLVCDRCGIEAELDGQMDLPELNQRAAEHAEVCGG